MHKEYLEYYKSEWQEYFVFNGHSSEEFGISLIRTSEPTPAPGYVFEHIPGRHGEIITDTESFQNVEITYKCSIFKDAYRNLRNLAGLLMTAQGYTRLEDSYHPDVFRMAVCKTQINPEMFWGKEGANFEITFSCKPQQWLKTGEMEEKREVAKQYGTTILDKTFEIYNPTNFNASPLIRFNTSEQYYESSTKKFKLTINGTEIQFKTITNDYQYDYVLDCETGETHGINKTTGNTFNINKYISAVKKIPFLGKGKNLIHIYYEAPNEAPEFELYIKPRWWTL